MLKRFIYSKKGLIITSIVFTVFIVLVLPYVSSLTEEMTHSTFSPDTGFFYSIEDFNQAMIQYGQTGRNFYILMRWTFDVIWPMVYFTFFTTILFHLSSKHIKNQNYIILVPIAAVIMDLLENLLASINVGIFPNQAVFLLRMLQVFSMLKWISIGLILIAIIYLLILYSIQKTKNKN